MTPNAEQLIARLRENPRDAEAYAGLMGLYRQAGDLASVVKLAEGWARNAADGDTASLAYQEAAEAVLESTRDAERAASLLWRAVQHSPLNGDAAERLQLLLEDRGEYGKLAEILQAYVGMLQSRDPGSSYLALLHFRLGEVLNKRLGRADEALAEYLRAIELDPALLAASFEARDLCLASGDLQGAADLYEMEANYEPDRDRKVSLLTELARLQAEKLDNLEGAITALRSALSIAQGDIHIMHELAVRLIQRAETKDEDGAAADYRRVSELFYRIAQAVPEDTAMQYLESALSYAPYHDGALDLLEQLSTKSGRGDILPPYLVAYVSWAPEGPEVDQRRLQLAQVYKDAGQLEDAIACIAPTAEQGNRQAATLLDELQGLVTRAPAATRDSSAPSAAPSPQSPAAAKAVSEPQLPSAEQEPQPPEEAPAVEVPAELGPEPPSEMEPEEAAARAKPAPEPTEPPGSMEERLEELRRNAAKAANSRKLVEAAAYYQEIITLDPLDQDAFGFLETFYRRRRNHEELRELLLASTRVPGLSVDTRKERLREVAGISEAKLRDVEGAIDAWRAIVDLDPADGRAAQTLKRLLEKLGKWDELVQVLDREALAATDSELKAELIAQIARIHAEKRKDIDEAAEAYRQLHTLRPHDKAVRDALCEAFLQVQNFAGAAPLLQEQVEDCSDDREKLRLLRRLASVLDEKMAAPEEAYEVYSQIAELSGKDKQALDQMERIDQQLGRFDMLVSTLERRLAVAAKNERVALLVRMGEIADRELSDLQRSAEYFGQALDAAPEDASIRKSLLEVLDRGGKYDEAVELLREQVVLQRQPQKRAELLRQMARILAGPVQDQEAAADAWQNVLEIEEDKEALQFIRTFADTHDKPEQLADALGRLAQLESDPEELRELLLENADISMTRLGRPEEAIAALKRILEQIDPQCQPALDKLIACAEEAGDGKVLANALELQMAAARDRDEQIHVAHRLADLYELDLSDAEHAVLWLQRWSEADPDDVEPLRRVRVLLEKKENWRDLITTLDGLAQLEPEDASRDEAVVLAARLAFDKCGDAQGAWDRLAPLVRRGHADAEEAILELAKASGRQEMLAAIYINAAQEAPEPAEQAKHWQTVARIYDEYLGNPQQALEASLRLLATDLGDRSYLDQVDRLAGKAEAWERLARVYDRLLREADSTEAKVDLLVRHAQILETQAEDISEALDRILRACALDTADNDLFNRAEELALRANRAEDLLLVYDRRRTRSTEPREQLDCLLRAARLSGEALKDSERVKAYLKRALVLAESSPELWDEIAGVAGELDQKAAQASWKWDEDAIVVSTETEEAEKAAEHAGKAAGPEEREALEEDKGAAQPVYCEARRGLVAASRELADKAGPEFGVWLILRAVCLLRKELGDDRAAFDVLRHGIELFPTDAELHGELREVAASTASLDALDALLSKMIEETLDLETTLGLLERRGQLLEVQLKRFAQAADVYTKLLQLNPEHPDAPARLHYCLREAGRFQQLLLAIDRQLQRTNDPEQKIALHKEVASIWEVRLKNRWEALDAWKVVASLNPDDEEAAAAIARLQKRSLPPKRPEELFGDESGPEDRAGAANAEGDMSEPPSERRALDDVKTGDEDEHEDEDGDSAPGGAEPQRAAVDEAAQEPRASEEREDQTPLSEELRERAAAPEQPSVGQAEPAPEQQVPEPEEPLGQALSSDAQEEQDAALEEPLEEPPAKPGPEMQAPELREPEEQQAPFSDVREERPEEGAGAEERPETQPDPVPESLPVAAAFVASELDELQAKTPETLEDDTLAHEVSPQGDQPAEPASDVQAFALLESAGAEATGETRGEAFMVADDMVEEVKTVSEPAEPTVSAEARPAISVPPPVPGRALSMPSPSTSGRPARPLTPPLSGSERPRPTTPPPLPRSGKPPHSDAARGSTPPPLPPSRSPGGRRSSE